MFEAYAASKIGNTITKNFLTASWTTATAVITDLIKAPVLLVIYTDEDLYVAQGAIDMADPALDISGYLAGIIKADSYWPIVVESDADRYVKLRGVTSNGQARFTNTTYLGTR